jgi:2-polyprenyl-3-methyl-5-hydroxy-6-metoxy-1,4-benzoquinol methylase
MKNTGNIDDAYRDKEERYFKGVRDEIIPLLPQGIENILEIGCGTGSTLRHLKEAGLCRWAAGVELFADAAEEAKKNIDLALQGNIEQMELPFHAGQFDVILCLDVLEHLVDPWAVIKKLDPLLKPGGAIVASIPNVRFYKVPLQLLFKGRWEYKNEGILDRTHLRFFTFESARKLLEVSGLKVDQVLYRGMEKGGPRYRSNMLTFGRLTHLMTEQYIMRAVKA